MKIIIVIIDRISREDEVKLSDSDSDDLFPKTNIFGIVDWMLIFKNAFDYQENSTNQKETVTKNYKKIV